MINDVSTNLQDPPVINLNGEDVPFPQKSRQELERSGAPQPWIAAAPRDEVQRTLLAVISGRRDWALGQNRPGYITFVATTRLFRFKDDVAIRLQEVSQGTRVDVRSRSRVGKGDLGANRKRISQLLDAARALLPPGP